MTIKTFLGVPIEGDITESTRFRRVQYPQADLEPIIQALLDDDAVLSFGWDQYTPYFNDGEECVFGCNTAWVKLKDNAAKKKDDGDGDEDEDEYGEDDNEQYAVWGNTHLTGETLQRAKALEAAVEGGHFDDVLLKLFGDHANVEVTRSGITISFYDHN